MLRQRAQHALSLCAEACWLAPSTVPSIHCTPRRAGWCSTTSALTGARCARRRAWHGWLERRGCRSTPRRMGAAEAARQAAGIAAAKAPALCFAFARVLRQLSVYHSRRTLPRCFFIGVSLLRILVLSSSSCVGAVRILVSLAPSRGGVLQLRGNLVHGTNPRSIRRVFSYY